MGMFSHMADMLQLFLHFCSCTNSAAYFHFFHYLITVSFDEFYRIRKDGCFYPQIVPHMGKFLVLQLSFFEPNAAKLQYYTQDVDRCGAVFKRKWPYFLVLENTLSMQSYEQNSIVNVRHKE